MISHVSIGVRDLGRSAALYDAVLGALGYTASAAVKAGERAYGPKGRGLFWLYEVAGEGMLGSAGSHFAFVAPAREALHSAAQAAEERGAEFTRAVGPHPDISPDYYGAIFLDPDGHKIELVVE